MHLGAKSVAAAAAAAAVNTSLLGEIDARSPSRLQYLCSAALGRSTRSKLQSESHDTCASSRHFISVV